MVLRAVIAASAVLVGTFFAWTDAVARGGGGFHGGGIGAFHAPGSIAAWRGGTNWRGMPSRGFAFRGFGARNAGRSAMARHDGDSRSAHRDGGHWHRSPGFGDGSHKSSNLEGEW